MTNQMLKNRQTRPLHSPKASLQLRSHARRPHGLRRNNASRQRQTRILDANRKRRSARPRNPIPPQPGIDQYLCPNLQQMYPIPPSQHQNAPKLTYQPQPQGPVDSSHTPASQTPLCLRKTPPASPAPSPKEPPPTTSTPSESA